MKIKVIVTKWNYKTAPIGFKPAQIEYQYAQEFFFTWENNIVKTNNWQKPCYTLENVFKAIKTYFYGTQYEIIDFIQMNES